MCYSLIFFIPPPIFIEFIFYVVLSHIHFCHNLLTFFGKKLFWLKQCFCKIK